MKTYIATFMRHNPQTGNYETTRKIEAKTIASARKQARDIEKACVYGSMSLMSLEEVKENKKESSLVKVELLAFTGMKIAEYTAELKDGEYIVITKDNKELKFDTNGKQLNAKNPRFGNKLSFVA